MKNIKNKCLLWLAMAGLTGFIFSAGCGGGGTATGSHSTDNALIGAGLGAAAGAIIGHQSGSAGEGAAIGAGAGALGGYIIGNEQDKSEMRRNDPNYDY